MNAKFDKLIKRCSELIDENEQLYKRRQEAIETGLKYREEVWLLRKALRSASECVEMLTGTCPLDHNEQYARLVFEDCEKNCHDDVIDCWTKYFKFLSRGKEGA